MEPQAQLHKRPDQLRGPDDLGLWGICPPPFRNAVTANLSATPPTYGNLFYSRYQMDMTGSAETSTTEVWSFAAYPTPTEAPGNQPTTSLTNDIFGTGVDSSTNLVQGAAYPPAWYRSTYNPPGAFTCTFDDVGDPFLLVRPTTFSIPATTIGPQEANGTQG